MWAWAYTVSVVLALLWLSCGSLELARLMRVDVWQYMNVLACVRLHVRTRVLFALFGTAPVIW